MTCGIYCIENLVNNKKYIGQSIDIERRFRKHKSCLNRNLHQNSYLQNSWNKHGEENFKFAVIEECKNNADILNDRELHFISIYNSLADNSKGYNLTTGMRQAFIYSKETLEKMSSSHKGKKQSKETIKKILETRKGFRHSEETKQKLSDSRKGEDNPRFGIKVSKETKEKMQKNNYNAKHKGKDSPSFGKTPSDETRKKTSEAMKLTLRLKKEALYGKL